MNFFKIKSYAKINLSLNVIKKLPSKFHKIESVISFIKLHDLIFLKPIKLKKHKIIFLGKFAKGLKKKNSVKKLFKILDNENFLKNQKFEIKIVKNIPQKSGMGGGSMNASNIINFLIKKKFLKIDKKKIERISNLIGSDVILGINSKEKTINSKYNFIKIVKKLSLNLVIIKPSFGCSTKTIYSNIRSFSKTKLKIIRNSSVKKSEILKLNNDLEVSAFKKYTKLRSLKSYLSKLQNVFFVRMTGSGSAIVAYFRSEKAALIALKAIKRKYKNYWCIISKTI